MFKMQSIWFSQLLIGHYYKGREQEMHSSPDDPPENLPEEWYLDLKMNSLGMIRIEKFPGVDSWHFYLISTLTSAVFLVKSQPEPCVTSSGRAKSPPISHWAGDSWGEKSVELDITQYKISRHTNCLIEERVQQHHILCFYYLWSKYRRAGVTWVLPSLFRNRGGSWNF